MAEVLITDDHGIIKKVVNKTLFSKVIRFQIRRKQLFLARKFSTIIKT
jgi:hypothetical protein